MRHNRKRIILFFLSGFLTLTFPAASQDSQRDPFSPLIGKNGLILIAREIDIAGMILQGIIYSQRNPVAIINDEVIGAGAMIGEYKVLAIEEKRVVLEKDNQEFILKLEE